ncbi:MAG: hypothetical protein KatS3mg032_0571 [Cyclobacteriaceae bacterium]|nr:MAG: hypothetical protein KatS3mg032_0571 [Cyclobacteriaceae bacterium]
MVRGNYNFRGVANVHLASRLKQILVLITMIILGILFAGETRAQQPRYKVFKSKKACVILARKRSQPDNLKVLAKKVKYRPQAEVEAPAALRTGARRETKMN